MNLPRGGMCSAIDGVPRIRGSSTRFCSRSSASSCSRAATRAALSSRMRAIAASCSAAALSSAAPEANGGRPSAARAEKEVASTSAATPARNASRNRNPARSKPSVGGISMERICAPSSVAPQTIQNSNPAAEILLRQGYNSSNITLLVVLMPEASRSLRRPQGRARIPTAPA
jgi:hypothetical protein